MFGVREIPDAMKGIQAVSRTSFWRIVREVKLRLHSLSAQMKLRVFYSFFSLCFGECMVTLLSHLWRNITLLRTLRKQK